MGKVRSEKTIGEQQRWVKLGVGDNRRRTEMGEVRSGKTIGEQQRWVKLGVGRQ